MKEAGVSFEQNKAGKNVLNDTLWQKQQHTVFYISSGAHILCTRRKWRLREYDYEEQAVREEWLLYTEEPFPSLCVLRN